MRLTVRVDSSMKGDKVIKYVEFAGLWDHGVREFGRIMLEKGKIRAEGGRYIKRLVNEKVRDLRPRGDQRWVGKEAGELFLFCLPYYYCGTYLCSSCLKVAQE